MNTPVNSFLVRAKELTPKQEQLDVNDNGKIDKNDFDQLNDGTPPDPVGGSAKVNAGSNIHRFVQGSGGELCKEIDQAKLFDIKQAVAFASKIENSAIIPRDGGKFIVVVMFHPAVKW